MTKHTYFFLTSCSFVHIHIAKTDHKLKTQVQTIDKSEVKTNNTKIRLAVRRTEGILLETLVSEDLKPLHKDDRCHPLFHAFPKPQHNT